MIPKSPKNIFFGKGVALVPVSPAFFPQIDFANLFIRSIIIVTNLKTKDKSFIYKKPFIKEITIKK